jgi:hypothetical protein
MSQGPDVLDQLANLLVAERRPEGRHPRPADRSAPVRDEVEEILIGQTLDAPGVGEIARPHEEE